MFSFFWKKSITKHILMNQGLELFAPEYALEEINKYKKEIMEKTRITEQEFVSLRKELAIAICFTPAEEYKQSLKTAIAISPDENDIDFFALALQMNCALWSNDKTLKQQNKIKILTTKQVLEQTINE
jgi:predicted nucleic acid-binding protein